MKKLTIIGLVIGILGLLAALINQFYYIPKANALELIENNSLDFGGPGLWAEFHHLTVVIGEIAVIISGIAFLLVIVPVFKTRTKLTFVAVLIAILGLLMGLAQGTHMFS